AHRQSGQRSEKHGHGDQECGLGGGQVKRISKTRRKRADQSPRRETDGEGNRTQPDMPSSGHIVLCPLMYRVALLWGSPFRLQPPFKAARGAWQQPATVG